MQIYCAQSRLVSAYAAQLRCSANCTKVDARTQEMCAEITALRQELAVATEARRLRAYRLTPRADCELPERGGSIAADPVGGVYAWLSGGVVSVRDVGFGFPLAFALLIEIVSAFGPVTISGYATRHGASRSVMPDRSPTWPDMTGCDRP